jgi:2-keto-4-pentenoate hydratase/2-oxohepta-3-ene-1,7-dioic acid hydratase in catechol pathway
MKMRSLILAAVATVALATSAAAQTVTKYVRYQAGNTTSYGILEGDTIRELQGSIFENAKPTGRTRTLADVKLLAPVEPRKVIAAGLNYKSHIRSRSAGRRRAAQQDRRRQSGDPVRSVNERART